MTHIGIMGAHGTGKSTLAWQLAQTYKRCKGDTIRMVTEVARRCPFAVNRDTSEEAQAWIFHMQMISEIEACARAEIVICDRTVWDSLAYAQAAGFDDLVDACMLEAIRWSDRYTEICFLRPIPGRLQADGFRDPDPAFQKQIDEILAEWVRVYSIPVREVGG